MIPRHARSVALLLAVGCSSSQDPSRGGTGGVDSGGGGGGAATGGSSSTGGTSLGGTGGLGTGGLGTGGSSTVEAGVGGDASVDAATGGSGTGGTSPVEAGADAKGDATVPKARLTRFVHAAPAAAAMDVCVKRAADSTFADPPVLEAHGIPSGLAFSEISDYFDLGLTGTDAYDFRFVEGAGTTCAPPLLGQIGNLVFAATAPITIGMDQYQFGAVPGYNGTTVIEQGKATPGVAELRYSNLRSDPVPTTDLYATPTGGAEAEWFAGVVAGVSTAFHSTVPNTFSFRVTSGGTQTVLATRSGVGLLVDAPVDLFRYATSTTTWALLVCPATQVTLVATCL